MESYSRSKIPAEVATSEISPVSSPEGASFKRNDGFAVDLPAQLQAALQKQEITADLLEEMSEKDWDNFAYVCREQVPLGQILRFRRSLRKTVLREPCIPAINESKLLERMQGCVGKLVDGEEGCGTLIYIGKALGLCAFHSVIVKEPCRVKVLDSSLSVDGYGLKLRFVHPEKDIAVYHIHDKDDKDREGPYIELENSSAMYAGNHVFLLSYPAFDSQTHDGEECIPMLSHGHIARVQLNRESDFSVGQYESFPNSSGGAVLSRDGKLLGIHLESLYFEDHSYYRPPLSPVAKGGPIYVGKEGGPVFVQREEQTKEDPSLESEESLSDAQSPENKYMQCALANISSKSCLGVFLSVTHIRSEVVTAGLFKKKKRNHRAKRSRKSK